MKLYAVPCPFIDFEKEEEDIANNCVGDQARRWAKFVASLPEAHGKFRLMNGTAV